LLIRQLSEEGPSGYAFPSGRVPHLFPRPICAFVLQILNPVKKSSEMAALLVSAEGQQLSPLHACVGQCTARAHVSDQKRLPPSHPQGTNFSFTVSAHLSRYVS